MTNHSPIPLTILKVCLALAPVLAIQQATAQVVPYTSDANTGLLDHFNGTTSATISAYNYNAAPTGTAYPVATPSYSFGQGPNGLTQALTLNPPVGMPAGSGTYLNYPGGQLLSQSNGTIEFWVIVPSFGTGLNLIQQGQYFNAAGGWTFGMSVDATGQLSASAWAAFSMNSGTTHLTLNTWTHVAATWGSSGAKLYINGVLVGSDANTGMPASGYSGSILMLLGTHTGISSSIDELRVSNIQRTTFNATGVAFVPTITSFTPMFGPLGTNVVISGTNFNSVLAKNIVSIGAVHAPLTSGSSTSLTVSVPSGASFAPILVTDTVTHLSASSAAPFVVTFPGSQNLDTNSFASGVNFATGTGPGHIVVCDLDVDGKPDIIVPDVNVGNGTTFSVLRNTSSSGSITAGSFASKVDFTVGTYPWGVAAADLDGDGKPEIIVVNTMSNTVSVLRNTSTAGTITTGSFASKVDFATGSIPFGIAVGDLDGDGKPDLVVTNGGSSGTGTTISVFRNTSTAGSITTSSFAAKVDFTVGTYPTNIAIGDIDGDGKPDIAVANINSQSVSVLRNTSTSGSITTGSFATKVDFSTGSHAFDLDIVDVDGDGKQDLVVANGGQSGDTTISVFRNIASSGSITTGSFASRVDYYPGLCPNIFAVGDVNGDGKPDIVVSSSVTNAISILRNTSTSGSISTNSFATRVKIPTATISAGGALSDVDGDGKPDIVLSSGTLNTLGVFRNTMVSAPPTITSFTPASGPIGTSVVISGTNFNSISAKNVVYFGAVKASVTSGTITGLTVNVPVGTTYAPITVTDTTTGLTTYSSKPFTVTFSSSQVIDATTFASKVDFTSGSSPYYAALGDIDGDGKPDLVVANSASNIISIFRNTSTSGSIVAGSFATKVDFATGSNPNNVVVGDIDGDGKLDIIVTSSASNTVSVFRNTSTSGSIIAGSLAARIDFATGVSPFGACIGDLDGDGKPDIVVGNYGSNTISVFRNTSISGSMTAGSLAAKVDFVTGTLPDAVAIGDLDGDGRPDIAVTNYSANTVSVFRNTCTYGSIVTGSFSPKADFTTGSNPYGVTIADIDGDSKPDIIAANYSSSTISVIRNTSTAGSITAGSFATKVDFNTGSGPITIGIGDIDGDGKPDLATSNLLSTSVSVFRNTSTTGTITAGSLASKVDLATGSSLYFVTIGDIDGDGKPDMAVANYGSSSVSVFRNALSGAVSRVITFQADLTQLLAAGFNASTDSVVVNGSFNSWTATHKMFRVGTTNLWQDTVAIIGNAGDTIQYKFKTFPDAKYLNSGWEPGLNRVYVLTPSNTTLAAVQPPITVKTGLIANDVTVNLRVDMEGAHEVYGGTTISNLKTVWVAGDNLPLQWPINWTYPDTNGYLTRMYDDGTHGDAVAHDNIWSVSLSFLKTNYVNDTIQYKFGADFTGVQNLNSGVRFLDNESANGTYRSLVLNDVAGASPMYVYGKFGVMVTLPPNITSFTPTSAAVGATVNLSGTNFNTTAVRNIVRFGAVRTSVLLATSTSLSVKVPPGATYAPISVTDSLSGLTDYSTLPFSASFTNGQVIAQSSFATRVDSSTGLTPNGIAIADLDGDGRSDVVTPNYAFGTNTISVLRNTGTSGTVSFARKTDYATGSQPFRVAVADLDGDGKQDIAVTNSGANTMSVFRNTSTVGSLSFAARIDSVTRTSPIGIAIGDIDGDGKPDVVVANNASGSISVYRNTSTPGSITFAPRTDVTIGNYPYDIVIADIDGDGKSDIVVSNNNSSSLVSVLRNTSSTGSISFAVRIDLTAASSVYTLATADIDGDGKLDIVAANYLSSSISVLRNISGIGSISFSTKVDFTTGTSPISVSVGDIDGDGKPDLATANYSSASLSLLKNTSSGAGVLTFAQKVDLTAGSSPSGVFLADVDGDGKPDLASVNAGNSTASFFRNLMSTASNTVSFGVDMSKQRANGGILTGDTIRVLIFTPTTLNRSLPTTGKILGIAPSSGTDIYRDTVNVGTYSGAISYKFWKSRGSSDSVRYEQPYGSTGNRAFTAITGANSIATAYFSGDSVGAPLALAATSATSSSFSANWNAVTGATSYLLDVSTVNTFSSYVTGYQNRNVGSVTNTSVTGLNSSTTYYYRLRAVALNATSINSNIIVIGTLSVAAPSITVNTPAQNWATGYTYQVTWSIQNVTGNVTIRLSTDNGLTYPTTIASNVLNVSSYSFNVLPNQVISGLCVLKVELASNPTIFGVSRIFGIVSGSNINTSEPAVVSADFASNPSSSLEYRLVSFPGYLNTTTPVKLGLSGTQDVDWKMFREPGTSTQSFIQLTSGMTLKTGEGYWYIQKGTFSKSVSFATPALSGDATITINLTGGKYSIIGNPFNVAIPWASVLALNNLSLTTPLYSWKNGWSSANTALEPGVGYYINSTGITTLKIPYDGFGFPSQTPAEDLLKADWRLQLTFATSLNSDDDNFIGIVKGASQGKDEFEYNKPPLVFDGSFLYMERPDWNSTDDRYFADYRPDVGSGQTWDFEVTNPGKALGTLTVKGVNQIPDEYDASLVNEESGINIDLRKQQSLHYGKGTTQGRFKIIVGPAGYVAKQLEQYIPKKFSLEQNYPNPFNPSTTITFRLPNASPVTIEVFTLLGQKIKQLVNGSYKPGTYQVVWLGDDDAGKKVTSGVYFYRIVAGNELVQVKKMVLTK